MYSGALFKEFQTYIPGAVRSPVIGQLLGKIIGGHMSLCPVVYAVTIIQSHTPLPLQYPGPSHRFFNKTLFLVADTLNDTLLQHIVNWSTSVRL